MRQLHVVGRDPHPIVPFDDLRPGSLTRQQLNRIVRLAEELFGHVGHPAFRANLVHLHVARIRDLSARKAELLIA